jgi:hypothetical protein
MSLDSSIPREMTKSGEVPVAKSALVSRSHGCAVAFSALSCSSPFKSVVTAASARSGSKVSTQSGMLRFGCTHEGRGWETPSSAASAPPQPNDDEISEKERNPNGAPMALSETRVCRGRMCLWQMARWVRTGAWKQWTPATLPAPSQNSTCLLDPVLVVGVEWTRSGACLQS